MEGQYVLKDIILVAAGMTIAAGTFRGGRLTRDEPDDARHSQPPPPAEGRDTSQKPKVVLPRGGRRSAQDICEEHQVSPST